jgi:hypothetical protein
MRPPDCVHEPDVIAYALKGGGPAMLGEELHQHVEGCETCGELLKVIAMLHQDHAAAAADVAVPAAGQVWWRAAVRARLEAAQAAARPMAWAQGMTGATLFGITCAVIVLAWPSLGRLAGLLRDIGPDAGWGRWVEGWDGSMQLLPSMLVALERSLPLALVVIAAVVVMPLLVLYFALAGDD